MVKNILLTKEGKESIMKKVRKISLICAVLCIVMVMGSQAKADNLVLNPSMETEFNATRPDQWVFGGLNGTPGYITSGTAGVDTHTGTHSVTITNPGSGHRWYGTKIAVAPSTEYTLSTWVKTENLDADDFVEVRFTEYDSSNTLLGTSAITLYGNTGWTELSGSYTTHANVATIQPKVVFSYGANAITNANSIAYFDDVSMTPEPATMVLLGLGGVGLLIRRRRRA